ncbi:MAG TPA: pilus assembly protein PilM [Cellulomonas sp.]
MARTQVGIDLGSTEIRAVEVENGRNGARVVKAGTAPLEPGVVEDGLVVQEAPVVRALRGLWRSQKFGSKDVVLGIGNERVYVRDLTLPTAPLAQLREALPFRVQDMLPVPVADCLLDFRPLREHGGEVNGLLVAVPEALVQTNVDVVEQAGLRVQAVDLSAFALLRALARGDLSGRTVALVDVGACVTQVVISDATVPRLVRYLGRGGRSLTQDVARSTGITPREAEGIVLAGGAGNPAALAAQDRHRDGLVTTIGQTLAFSAQQGGRPVEGIVLTGRGSRLAGLGQQLATVSRLPVSFGSIGAGFDVSRLGGTAAAPETMSQLPMATGLASAA